MTINPLFLGLLAAGAVLVVSVLIYNWVQARRLRDRGAAANLDVDARVARDAGHGRAEPVFEAHGESDAAVPESAAINRSSEASGVEGAGEGAASFVLPRKLTVRTGREGIAPDADIECVVWLTPSTPAPTSALAQSLGARCAKPTRWLGRSGSDPHWRAIDGAAGGPWQEIAACMLLADRNGAASRDDLEGFLRLVDSAAGALHAECVWPDERDEAKRAEALDRLCADLDVQIGLTLLKGEANQIAGTRLRGVAEASGFRLSASGQFEYVHEETGAMLYSLQNLREEPFTVESLRAASVPGVVLLLDVPRVPEPVKAFDQMRLLAKRLSQTLEATLVDDNHRPVDDAALAAIRAQVQATAAALREAHIEPGGQRALRLFG
ncbi:MAG TPA: cell division protein ZipA C-terminal FtsZ-binding domain-containing protein [Casimicrobiaceae bacterium]|jgi:hypothetical protein|nr:cell division protein ZipA C-terminal FtsZ-binding domain-containing protein [Casimicrobiaceae bacterium]